MQASTGEERNLGDDLKVPIGIVTIEVLPCPRLPKSAGVMIFVVQAKS